MLRVLLWIGAGYLAAVLLYAVFQRKLLYYPTHHNQPRGLTEWRHEGRRLGYAREVSSPRNVWLMMHGNGGEASDREYALTAFSPLDSVFILEYPGYGLRSGKPSLRSINAAAREGYRILRSSFPRLPVCVVGESLGSGPASMLAQESYPPDKIVLITPFDTLSRVADHHFPFLPARLLLMDNWDNVRSLKEYRGPLEIFGARDDDIIPISHSLALARSKPSATFHEIGGGHNDWSAAGVTIHNP